MPPQAAQQGQSDSANTILWIIALFFFLLTGAWLLFGQQIITFYLKVKLYQINVLDYFFSGYFREIKLALLNGIAAPKQFEFWQVANLGAEAGTWLRFPYAIILFILAGVLCLSGSTSLFKNIYTMKKLVELEKQNWPQITPVANLDLLKMDIDTGPWAMALQPMQFCKRYKLIEEVRSINREALTRKDRERIEVVLKVGQANKIFALQLGAMWKGTEKLPLYVKALFAIFAARINADTQAAADLTNQLAISSKGKLNFNGVNELCKKHENTKLVRQVISSHAYVLTVMAGMLAAARDDGVQASADFLWLKVIDRRLWYTLNTVGRQTPFVEVAGIFAHYLAEKTAARKIIVPMIDEATKALDIALKEVIYRPD